MTILASVADALDAAHAAGVIHRDIKPANVLLDPGPRAYLTDFGLARDPNGIALTAPGQVLGTIDYMAPELLDGVRVGAATDIYGLACVAVETLTGRVPFPRENDAATTYAHVMGPPPKVSERRPELPQRSTTSSPPAWPRRPMSARPRPAPWCWTCCARSAEAEPEPRSRPARCPAPDQQAEAAAGEALGGRYEIVAPISSGAMGAVYRAVDRESGDDVAVKRLLDVRHAARFEIEARLLASLSHPRLVKVLDHASDDEGAYIVMELVTGTDLGALLKRDGDPGLALADGIEYARHGCEALQYVHNQQIVHRDVKPPNMILGDDGVVLVDFGVARALGGEEDQGTIAVGTPKFMAPEILAGGTVSAVSDVYSMAATLWTLLVGSPPRYGDAARLEKLAPELDPDLREALAGGLELLPEERIASASAFAEAIGAPLTADRGESLAQSLGRGPIRRRVMEAIVRTAAGMFDAAACSIALTDPANGDLVYEAAWGAGAAEVVGLRLAPGRRHGRRRGRQRRGRRRPRVPQGPALRPPGRRQDRLRSLHDGGHPAGARRQDDRRAVAAGPARRRALPAARSRPLGPLRRSRRRRPGPRRLPAQLGGRADLAGLSPRGYGWPR